MKNNTYSNIFVILVVLNIVCLLTSNIITSKLVSFFGLVVTAGDFLFPISYIINDIIVEVYGYQKAKFSVIISFLASFLMILFIVIAVSLPYPTYYIDQESFSIVFSYTPRIVLASLLAYLIGNIINSKIMNILKNKVKLFSRTIFSSVIGEAIDTIIFLTIAFIGTISNNELIILIISVYLFKLFIEILFTPLLICFIKKIKIIENIERK